MIDWDCLPFQPQPTQAAAGQEFAYIVPEGRIGRLYWITVRIQCGVPSVPGSRYLHMELGGIVFEPGTSPYNFFGKIRNLMTCEYFLAPGIPQYTADYVAMQCAPMMKVNEIMPDHTYQIRTYVFGIMPQDQITVSWGYKEQDLE